MGILSSISIGINPNLIDIGNFILSWHGVMTFIAVAVAVWLVARWGAKEGMIVDSIYSVSVWAIIGGVVGARALHVIDFWDEVYKHDFVSVFLVWSGGIAIYGAILGGFAGGALYIIVRNSEWFLSLWRTIFPFMGEAHRANLPSIGRLADITAPALLIAQAIGRIGDIINGEHCSRATDLIWGWVFTHPDSPGRYCILNDQQGYFGESATSNTPVHPAVVYEMIWNMISLAIVWRLRDRLTPDGSLWMVYLALYAIGRFSVQWVRLDAVKFAGLQEAHIIAILVLAVAVPFLVLKTRFVIRSGASGDHQVARGRRRRKAQAGQT